MKTGMKIAAIVVAFYASGMGVWLYAMQRHPDWYDAYRIWDKGKDLLFLGAIYYLTPVWFRKPFLPVLIFSIVRLLWQITATLTALDNNMIEAVNGLLMFLALTCFVIFLIGLKQWFPKKQC